MFVYIQPLSVTKDNFLPLIASNLPHYLYFYFTLIFTFILIIFYYTKQFVLSYFIIFIILNNYVTVVHTCVDVTP